MNIVYMKESSDVWAVFLQSFPVKVHFGYPCTGFPCFVTLRFGNSVNPTTLPGTWKTELQLLNMNSKFQHNVQL